MREEERGVPPSSSRDVAVGPEPQTGRDQCSQAENRETREAGVGPENDGPPPATMKDACVCPTPRRVRGRGTQTEEVMRECYFPSSMEEEETCRDTMVTASPPGA